MEITPALLQQLMGEVEDAVRTLQTKRRALERAVAESRRPQTREQGLLDFPERHDDRASDPS
jgi:hypothetical protein